MSELFEDKLQQQIKEAEKQLQAGHKPEAATVRLEALKHVLDLYRKHVGK